MAELLIKAISHIHPDSEKNITGAYKKGDIVVIMPDGHVWGAKEGPPKFVLAKVPGLDEETIQDRQDSWNARLEWTVVGTDPVVDGVRLRAYLDNPGSANQYGLTRAKVEGKINSFNGTVVSTSSNAVTFDMTVEGVYTSESFWGYDIVSLGVQITEIDYNQSTGVHTATIDVSNAPSISVEKALQYIESVDSVVTDITGDIITCEFYRSNVRSYAKEALRSITNKVNVRRRYHFSEADVDTVLGMGGEITLTETQLQNKVIDKSA